MILIFGGAYQGKLDYAMERFGGRSVFQCTETAAEIDFSKDIINSFHLLALARLRLGADTPGYIGENLGLLGQKIIISDDISCGIVPIDPEARRWREAAGRSLALLARHADEVVRVFCGIGTVISQRGEAGF